MKRVLFYLLASFLLLSSLISVGAADFPMYTDRYVNDFAGVLNTEQTLDLKQLFYQADQDTSAEVVFVSSEECASYGGPSKYAIDLLNYWRVGKSDKNNGLLILYCKQESKIFATVGYGLEGILPDSKLGRLLDENYVPMRDSGNVQKGITDFSYAVTDVLNENKEEVLSGQAGGSGSDILWSYLPFFIWVVIIILIIISRAKRHKKTGKRTGFWWIPLFLPSHGSHSASGGFGGGGFGGGFGGGGGAGR